MGGEHWIDGLILSGYRSFGPEPQKMGPFRKINLLVGKNNSGKSNIIRFLYRHYGILGEAEKGKFARDDHHKGSLGDTVTLGFARRVPESGLEGFLCEVLNNRGREHIRDLAMVLKECEICDASETLWFAYQCQKLGEKLTLSKEQISHPALHKPGWEVWAELADAIAGKHHTAVDQEGMEHNIALVLGAIATGCFKAPPVKYVPAMREITKGGGKEIDCSGAGLVEALNRFQRPHYTVHEDRKRFEEITRFFRHVTNNQQANLEIPHVMDTIQFDMDGKVLPLSAMGTGIHEVVILASIATVHEDTVICIEEPEIHLHPILQRKLLQYLAQHTSNQYVIATHSAHILDTEDAAVFHVTHDGIQTRVARIDAPSGRDAVCADLGYRASDLLQANCVIWVEGVSDRVYLRHWLEAADPDLKEGIHYSIMFYGGSQLTHLTANDEEVSDFINLKRFNRHMCVVMDSDKANGSTEISPTKRRITEELVKDGGLAWVTKGRAIENYLAPSLVQEAIQCVHSEDAVPVATGSFDDVLQYQAGNGQKRRANKVKVARYVVSKDPDLSVLDLKDRIGELVAFIKQGNGGK